MPRIDMSDYTPAARRYWWSVAALGLAAFAYALARIFRLDDTVLLQTLIGAATAMAVAFFPVRIPGTKTSLAGGEIFVFLVLLLTGAPGAVVAAGLEAFVASWRTSRRWTSRLGAPAIASVAMLAAGTLFDAARAALVAAGQGNSVVLAALLAFALFYFGINYALTRTLLALKNGAPIAPLQWASESGWIGLAYAASASIAGLLYSSAQQFGVSLLLVTVPLVAMFLSTLHSYFQRKEADERHVEELRESERRFHTAFSHAAIGMALVSKEGRFLQANRAFLDMLARTPEQLLAASWVELVHEDDLPTLQRLIDALVAGELKSVQAEARSTRSDGPPLWISLNISFVQDWNSGGHNLIVQAQDISARRRAEAELYHNAYHDSLTQLANRTYFMEQLNRAIARIERHPEQRFAVMYLDFDRFKMVNDSLGHKAGDQLLVHLGRRLQAMIRPTDVIARLGGDEFAILLEHVQRERDAVELTERIQHELEKPFRIGQIDLTITASIGIRYSMAAGETSEQILRDADIAMYKAKSKGKAQYALFDSSLHQHVTAQLQLETELRRALSQHEVFLEYQPIYALVDRQVKGFEALVRWNHPERGRLEPSSFIPTAEETGLIVPLGQWVLGEACRQMREWSTLHDNRRLQMSVNVSSVQLMHPDFLAQVQKAIAAAGMQPSQLALELTESVLMDGMENALSTLSALRGMGVTLSIDDFGTGYSSLSYLATLPIDALKVDRSFVERMSPQGGGSEIVKAIFKLGQALSKSVYAEGIETGTQLAQLQELGCEYGQGFLLSRPLDPAHAAGFLALRSDALADVP